ncbi:MAG: bifunctional pyr operon transcriptional regulator/uracil phosphoribosyltransferase PyrR [Longimicrobiaceae bacterium]
MTEAERRRVLDTGAVQEALGRMAAELESEAGRGADLALMGVHRRGVELASRLAAELGERRGRPVPLGTLDITLYRDDLMQIGPRPVVGETRLPEGGVDGRPVVIVDDVLFTGRTVRAALDELADFGRPSRTILCVLIDRGGRELPIHADVVGEKIDVPEGWMVEVAVPEMDGGLGVDLVKRTGE